MKTPIREVFYQEGKGSGGLKPIPEPGFSAAALLPDEFEFFFQVVREREFHVGG